MTNHAESRDTSNTSKATHRMMTLPTPLYATLRMTANQNLLARESPMQFLNTVSFLFPVILHCVVDDFMHVITSRTLLRLKYRCIILHNYVKQSEILPVISSTLSNHEVTTLSTPQTRLYCFTKVQHIFILSIAAHKESPIRSRKLQ